MSLESTVDKHKNKTFYAAQAHFTECPIHFTLTNKDWDFKFGHGHSQ